MDITEIRMDEAHHEMEKIDERGVAIALYISPDENPVVALRKIRTYLHGCVGESFALALAVAGLDRVLDQLEQFKLRRVLEER